MTRFSLCNLSCDEWLEICKFLSPCDSFRISQLNRFMYFDLFETNSNHSSQKFLFHLIEKQISDHFEKSEINEWIENSENSVNFSLHKLWPLNNDEKLWKSKSIKSRRDWKNWLRVYLRLSYLRLLKRMRKDLECEFLVYQPFRNIGKETNENGEQLMVDLKESEMEDVVLVHGYRDCGGKITIFNWERPNLKVETEITLTIPDNEIGGNSRYRDDWFRRITEIFNIPFIENLHYYIRIQEFKIPNRVFKIKVDNNNLNIFETEMHMNTLPTSQCNILIHTRPLRLSRTFPPSVLLRHFPFYHDVFALILSYWFMFDQFNNYQRIFRHTQETLLLPFNHPYLEGDQVYQYLHFAVFLISVLSYGAVGGVLSILPGFAVASVNILLGKFLDTWEYPETEREFRSSWNLLALAEFANVISSFALTARLSYKFVLWLDDWKNSIMGYINEWKRKKKHE